MANANIVGGVVPPKESAGVEYKLFYFPASIVLRDTTRYESDPSGHILVSNPEHVAEINREYSGRILAKV